MTYAPGIAEYVDRATAAMPPDYHTRPLAEQRALYDGLSDVFVFERPGNVEVQDEKVHYAGRPVPVRTYRPNPRRGRGCIIFLHGGGFVIGSLESHDTVVAELAANTGLLTLAVDYPRAPEQPFPAAIEEAYAGLCGAVAEADRLDIDPARVCLAGDSSGANMAVVVCMMARDRGGPAPVAQALVSPVLDFARWRTGGEDAPMLSGDEMAYFTHCYLGGEMSRVEDPYVSPLLRGRFDRLPPAYIWASEQDSLHVDAVAYAARLRAHGIAVELSMEPGFTHACLRARGLSPEVAEAWQRFCAATSNLLAASSGTGAVA